MSFLQIPRAEHDFMYVSIESDTLLTFWLIEETNAITAFAYLIGDSAAASKPCSRMCIRSDGMVAWSHYDESEDQLTWKENVGAFKLGEIGEFVEAYRLWKKEIEMILLGEEVMS